MTRLLTIAELSRALSCPYQTLLMMEKRGQLLPNSICGHSFLYDSSRLGEIAQLVETHYNSPAKYAD